MKEIGLLVSIIIPEYNAKNYLVQSLPAFQKSEQKNFELIVVDDNSTDDSPEIARKYADVVLHMGKNSGPAKARNYGAQESGAPILFFLDADVRIYPDTISRVIAAFHENPEISAVFGSYDTQPPEKNFFSQYKNLFHHYVHQRGSSNAKTFWAGCGAIRKTDFDAAGGFSAEFAKPSIEDVELGYKLRERGKTIRLLKDLQVTHLKKWTFLSLIKADILYRAIPWTLLALKKGIPWDLNFKLVDRLSGIAACLLFVSLCLLWRWAYLGFLALFLAVLLLFLHKDLYRFFYKKKGVVFSVFAIPYHWFYYLYSTLTFVLVFAIFLIKDAFTKKIKSY
jgi:glycosyltransferase involved in cell wall biosynthesis